MNNWCLVAEHTCMGDYEIIAKGGFREVKDAFLSQLGS